MGGGDERTPLLGGGEHEMHTESLGQHLAETYSTRGATTVLMAGVKVGA